MKKKNNLAKKDKKFKIREKRVEIGDSKIT